ncbi:MAG: non-ribosomal peptide synthetase, partial [Selenomonadaceae bacterium]|nr:non-ribosomal peptide synthetase [Selenomonadaceae bacterium]
MTKFIEQLEKNSKTFANRLALALDNKKEPVTYGELWDLSGKIYSYLKSHGVGKEDFVLINLPRSPKIVVALIGIWRAGAACTVTEKGYPAERVEYIRKDCNAKIVIDEKIFSEMLNGESLRGYEKTNPDDACFAVYTSGTTGNPKGALHEYGKLELIVRSYPKPDFEYDDNYKCAATYPLNFVAFPVWLIPHLYFGNSFYILSYEIIKDVRAFTKFIADEKISECFVAPSLLKIYKKFPANFQLIYIGGDNVSDIYFSDVVAKNAYALSETAFVIATFTINKSYHKTPVGKNNFGLEILILNEDGQKVSDGEQGEVCFENPYFRGYINLPEKTEKVFRDGIFHTGDLGFKDDNGNLIISGRADDMIKIHGNRVEPGEIEIVAKEILGVKNIIAKGFADEGTAFITLYGLTSEIGNKFDAENIHALREKLSKRLPEYMIPTYYMTLEKFPTNANGKVIRKLFPAPNVKPQQIEYVPPVTETEKIICEKMAEILNVKQIGRNADFYQMGGDSLKTILLVTECDTLSFQSSDVYKYRTAEKLAAFCDTNKNVVVKKKFSPMKALQEKIFPAINDACQNYLQTGTVRSMYSSFFAGDEDAMKKISNSICTEVTLREKVNPEKLQAAVNKAVEVCPYAAFDISKSDGAVYFHKNNLPLIVHKIGAIEEFGTAENNFHYVAIFYDADKIIFNISHILTDGFGINCFIQAVLDFYFGKEKTFYDGANKFDFVADLMTQDLPLPEGYAPKSYVVDDKFILPEEIGGKTYEYFVEMPAKNFDDFCKKYEISAQIAVSILLAKAVQMAHPDNKKIISVRGPVNTRIPLQVPNTFQNASIPHIFLNIAPNFLTDKNFDVLKKDFADQCGYENLAAFTNNVRKFFMTENPAERAEIVKAYKTQTDIFANYMGKILAEDIISHVESFRQKLPASYPLMMYALQFGDKIILQVIQSFENKIYVENL